MDVNVIDLKTKQSVRSLEISEEVFGCEYNEALIHQVVTAYRAYARAGTKAQKSRKEVSGGGIKPWRQKGTGRARAGSIRSPLWRKGGVTFAAKPRCFDQKVNKKMYRATMCSILSQLLRDNRIVVVDDFRTETSKTKETLSLLNDYSDKRLLIVADLEDFNTYLSMRNLKNIYLAASHDVDPYSLIHADYTIITAEALKFVEERVA